MQNENELAVPINQVLSVDEIKVLSTPELRRALADALTVTAKSLSYLATIWRELESRGEDLSELRHGMAVYLPQIADGTLESELVVRYAGQRRLLAALAQLPMEQQRRFAQTGSIDVVSIDENNNRIVENKPLHYLSSADVSFIFNGTRVLNADEQTYKITRARFKSEDVKPKSPRAARRVQVDHENQCLIVGARAAKLPRVIAALSEYYGVDLNKILESTEANHETNA